jgi:hypothetical protein
MVIVGGILQRNPFFVPPDEFLKELQSRGLREQSRRNAQANSPSDNDG